jgi:TolA-binding protein
MTRIYQVALALLVAASLAAPARAQQNVTQADIQRLQDNAYLAERDVTSLRARDAARATQLQSQLDDLKDEVIYLKVKLRKDGSLARSEYSDVRDRIDDVRSRAATNTAAAPATGTGSTTSSRVPAAGGQRALPRGAVEIPSGTELDVRLQTALNSGTAQVEDRFEATTLADVTANGVVAIPAGSVMRGVISSVEPATRTNRTAKMTVSFDQVTISGRAYPIHGTVTEAIQGEGIKGELPRAGAGAGVGAILGAVLGGAKGAVLGAVIGGGGTIAATEGKEIDLPQGTTLRVRIDAPVQIQSAGR